MRIAKVNESVHPPTVLIYGPPGSGKTTLAAQAPKPLLLIDVDRGSGYISPTVVPDWDEIDVCVEATPDEIMGIAQRLAASETKYRTVVVDTMTELQTVHRGNLVGSRPGPSLEDYSLNTEWCRRLFRYLAAARCCVVYICQDDPVGDEGALVYRPALTPAVARALEAYSTVISYLTLRSATDSSGTRMERIIVSAGSGKVRSKDRTGKVPAAVINPTWSTVYGEIWNGKEAKE